MVEQQRTDRQLAFLDWFVEVPRKGSFAQWARDNDTNEKTVSQWRKTEWFKDAVESRLKDHYMGPDMVLEVVAAAQKKAATGDTQAIKLYMQLLERYNPIRPVQEDKGVEAMTDEELDAAWAGVGGGR